MREKRERRFYTYICVYIYIWDSTLCVCLIYSKIKQICAMSQEMWNRLGQKNRVPDIRVLKIYLTQSHAAHHTKWYIWGKGVSDVAEGAKGPNDLYYKRKPTVHTQEATNCRSADGDGRWVSSRLCTFHPLKR